MDKVQDSLNVSLFVGEAGRDVACVIGTGDDALTLAAEVPVFVAALPAVVPAQQCRDDVNVYPFVPVCHSTAVAPLPEREDIDESFEEIRARMAESNLSYVEQRTLRAFMDMSENMRPGLSIIRQFLAKKAELPPTRKRKQAVFDEKPAFKATPTAGEAMALVAFLVYLLLTSVGTVKIGSIPLLGPSVGGAASAAPTKEDMHKLSQAISDTSIKDARALSANGDRKGSFAAIDRSLKVLPTADAYAERARMASALGYQESAVNDYTRAIEVKKDPSVILERGLVHLSSKNYSGAIADFSTVICLPSVEDKFRVYAFRARAHAQSGRIGNAVKDYKMALATAPSPDYPELAGYRNELTKCVAKLRKVKHSRRST
ncbi:MAG: hypothetical protein K2W95_17360 [Candidatus Obscuribacterales bacterium]|nr:hypothetical protein [Candidatus Obscuribacterales bacterium]